MGGDRLSCRDCGGSLPPRARFCSGCGLPVDASLDEQFTADVASDADVTAIGPSMERSRPLVMMVAVIGALLLAWSIVSSAGDGSTESAGSITTDLTSPVSTGPVTTTAESAALSTVTPRPDPEPLYVNDTRGPVLGDGVEGILFGVAGLRLSKVDLATGEITYLTLGFARDGGIVSVVGDEILLFDGEFLRSISLTTGADHDAVPNDESTGPDAWIAGPADAVSVWVVGAEGSDASSTVFQVDFTGEAIQTFAFDTPFSVDWARGTKLYLDGPGGSWVFDTITTSVTALKGQVIRTDSDAIVLLACESTLECQVSIDTGTGMAPTSALSAADVAEGPLHISPDLAGAFVRRYVGNHARAESTYIDLDTGDRVEFGELPIGYYSGILWLPNTSWIIAIGVSPVDLMAVNTDTGFAFELELPGRGGGWGGSNLGLIPAS